MKRLENRGFGAIEVILIVIIVGLLGVVGWYVYNQRTDQNAEQVQTTAQDSSESDSEITDANDLEQVESDLNKTDVDSDLDTSEIDSALNQ